VAQDRPRKPGTPAWKAAGGGSQKPAAGGPQFAWKPQGQAAQSQVGRRLKLAGVAFGGLGCLALIIVLIYWLRPQKGACLVLIGADPMADVEKLDAPLDVYGWHGGERLAGWSARAAADDHTRQAKLTPQLIDDNQTPESLQSKNLSDFFQKLERRELNPLIVYIGLHGGADAAGPFLFATGGERLYMRELIDRFSLPPLNDKHVVLLIDSARLTPDPALGVLLPDFVRALKALEDERLFDKVPKLVVICATDVGERGWSAEEWGTTGFAQMLLRGLSGEAEPSHGAVINAWDLFKYVREKTQSWSQSTRPTAQTPILLPITGGQQRAEQITLTAKVAAPAGFPDAVTFAAPKSLTDHWAACKALEDGSPSPAVYTPRLWRRYRELLLRYEYLLRGGEDAAARKLGDILDRTEQDLRDGRGLRLTDGQPPRSRTNDLPLPTALGMTVEPLPDAPFNKIWGAPEATWDQLWEELLKTGGPPDVLRAQFYDFLLRQSTTATATRDTIDKAARLMARPGLSEAGTPRPVEAHLLVMTRQFFTDPRPQAAIGNTGESPIDTWKHALLVRRQAELAALGLNVTPAGRPAHPYSEQLWTFLGPTVETADIRRRDGEDRLFSSQEAGHARAKEEIDAAGKQYEDVLRQAKSLQAAYAVRDVALADLPPLTRWVSSQPAKPGDGRVEDLKTLWLDKVHPLARRLDGNDRPAGLDQLTEEVRQKVDLLKEDYKARCRDLKDKDLQGLREQVEQVLGVPPMLVEPDLRKSLVESSSRQAAKLSGEWVANPTPVATPSPTAVEDIKAARRAQALQWGRLAAAMLGDIPKDQRSDRKGELFGAEALQTELAKLPADNWQPAADMIGDQIGRHWQALAGEPGASATGVSPSPVADAPGSPNRAEFRSRFAIAFGPTEGAEPATVNRQKRWQALLVGMALRTARDHWYEVDKRPKEYFRAAAGLYLEDSTRCAVAGAARTPNTDADARQVQTLLTTDALVLEPVGFGQRVNWTSENRRTLSFTVRAKEGPGGYITLWPQIGQSASLSLIPDDLPRQSVPLQPAAKRDLHVEAKRTATDDSVKLAAHGYFRGQWLKAETEIKLNRTPETIVARATPPNDAAVAVRASDDLDVGAISIVLDFSGSMAALPPGPDGKPRPDDWKNPDSKNQQALRTLREVLLGVPEGTPISLRLFGHKYDDALYNRLFAALPNKKDKDALEVIGTESTLSELIYKGKVTWSRANPRPLQDAILRKLEIPPQYSTPLLREMVHAKDDFPEDYKGAKTLVVLTDGADTQFPAANRVAKVKQGLKAAFADANIGIQMVLFRVDENELKTSLEQFKDVEETFQPPGRIWVAGENSKLTELLDLALRPKLRLLELSGETAKGMPRGGLPSNRPFDALTALRWTPPLDPKLYDGFVLQSRQRFNLQRGDRMLVRLSRDSLGVKFSRDLLADDPRLKGRVAPADDWVLGLPYYHAAVTAQDKQLWMTTTLESPRGRSPDRDGNLQQPRPAFVWWDVVPQSLSNPAPPGGVGAPTTVRVAERAQLPAPAWTMLAEGWPGGVNTFKPASIRAWADLAPPPAAYKIRFNAAALVAGEATADEPGEDGRVQAFASLENWPLRVDTDPRSDFRTAEPTPVPCLVVRILHPDKRPVFVRPVGVEFAASEQRFYGPSAAVTAVFGPVNSKDDLDAKLQGRPLELDLISVERFKTDHKPLILNMDPPGSEQPLVDPPKLGEKADKTP
jgi:hypothetical protein